MDDQQRILITGSTGYIGKHLVASLAAKNYELIVISSNERRAKEMLPEKVKVYDWKSAHMITEEYGKIDIVINLAGANIGKKRWTKDSKKQLIESRIATTEKLADLLLKLKEKPSLWIQASAIGYYGFNKVRISDENASKGSGFLADLTEKWEKSTEHISAAGIQLVFLRLGVVLDPSGSFLKPFLVFRKLKLGSGVGRGSKYLSWIHLYDLVQLVEYTIEKKNARIINAVAPTPIKMRELNAVLKEHFNLILTLRVPKIFLFIFIGKEKTKELLLADQYIGSAFLPVSDFTFHYNTFEEVFTKGNFNTIQR
ncbi:TIGR01777 family oxidoreductase [Bacteroidota bacterium]